MSTKKHLLLFYIACSSFFLLFSSGFVDSQDGFQYLAIARRMYFDHTLQMPTKLYPDENIHMSLMKGTDGKQYSPTGLGYSLALLPAVAASDVVLKTAHANPTEAFPLHSDWPVLLFASMTNAFIGGVFAVFLAKYLESFNISWKRAYLYAFLAIIGTNLFSYTKYVFPHMLFVTAALASFYYFRQKFLQKQNYFGLLSGITFGVLLISYNISYWFVVPGFGVYYLLLHRKFESKWFSNKWFIDALFFLVGVIPFAALYFWFNHARFGGGASTGYHIRTDLLIPPAYVLWEGMWGVLFSPGRSLFLYSPLLFIPIIFWHKLDAKKYPELLGFGTLMLTFIYGIATLLGNVDFLVWHGEASWGPRYMIPVVAFGVILAALVVERLSKMQKLLVALPLLMLGFWIQIIGMIYPYQIKFAGLEIDNFMNGRNSNVYEYGNFLPRYSPVFTMTKTFVKRVIRLHYLYDHGQFHTTFYDGFNLPYALGTDIFWREILPVAEIRLNTLKNPANEISIQVRNHQIDPTSSYSAQLKIKVGAQTEAIEIPSNEAKTLTFYPKNQKMLSDSGIELRTNYQGTSSALLPKQQVVFLTELDINGEPQRLSTLDYPYISDTSIGLGLPTSSYWQTSPEGLWAIWHMHSGVYENTPDIWWVRPLHYWDLPKSMFGLLFSINILALIYSSYYLWKLSSVSRR